MLYLINLNAKGTELCSLCLKGFAWKRKFYFIRAKAEVGQLLAINRTNLISKYLLNSLMALHVRSRRWCAL